MSAYIIDRTFGGTTDRGIVLNAFTGSETSSVTPHFPGCTTNMYRHTAIGSWSVIRMGIHFAIADYSGSISSSGAGWPRLGGFWWGMSSGSGNWFNDYGVNTTCAGVGTNIFHSHWMGYYGDSYAIMPLQTDVTGSFYYFNAYGGRGFVTGSVGQPANGYSGVGAYFWLPSVNQQNRKRGVMIMQLSASSVGRWALSLAGFASGSLISKGANKDYTANDLITAMTSSRGAFPPTCSGALMDVVTDTIATWTGIPLDTAFFVWSGGVPIEIYDWYIYKVA